MTNFIQDPDIELHWSEWNKLNLPDGMTIYDPDGFRNGRPTVVNFRDFLRARSMCTMIGVQNGGTGEWRPKEQWQGRTALVYEE